MRKTFCWLLCLLLIVSSISSAGAFEAVIADDGYVADDDSTEKLFEDDASDDEDDADFFMDEFEEALKAKENEPEGIQRGTKLVVGALTEPSGAFSTEMFGNNTADIDIRTMLHGYDTVVLTKNQGLVIDDTVVSHVQVGQQNDGTTVYVLTFSDQLRYNDGTPITAMDYAFSLLLGGAPEIAELGGTIQGRNHLAGYAEYVAGETNAIRGVRLMSEYQLAVYIFSDYVPYFYGYAMISMKPLPISEIAPGCVVRDDNGGIYIAAAENAADMSAEGLPYTPGVFSAEMLRETLLNEEHGYLSHPRRTSGPYSLQSYDPEQKTATFTVNGLYIGNNEGQKPHIENVEYRTVEQDTMLDDLGEGRVDVLNKMTDVSLLPQVLQADGQGRKLGMGSYMRTGMAYLAAACEEEPTSDVAVRRAIAMGIDKDVLIEQTMPGAALKVHAYYGLGQWMATYEDDGDPGAGVEPMAALLRLNEMEIPYDVAGANALLATAGWAYTEGGGKYAGEGIRYRKTDAGLEPLALSLAVTEDNKTAAEVSAILTEAFAQLGIGLTVDELSFPELLSHYYRQTERTYNLFFMASNFNYIFDPYYDFHTADEFQGTLNTTGLRDEELMRRASTLRQTPSMEIRTYVENWLHLQERFVEVLPLIPLYSNVYYDFYADTLRKYDIATHASWAGALLYAYFAEE